MLDELKKLFVQEVNDLLATVEKNLLKLEKDNENVEIIQDIFRTMHTIKGSAGVYNLEKTVLIAHSFENLFESIKTGDVVVSNEIISTTLKAKDLLLKLIGAESEDEIDQKEVDNLLSVINKTAFSSPVCLKRLPYINNHLSGRVNV